MIARLLPARLLPACLLPACATPLIDEPVLGYDIPATQIPGAPGEWLGGSLAMDSTTLLATTPGACGARLASPDASTPADLKRLDGPCGFAGLFLGAPVLADRARLWVDGDPWEVPSGMIAWAAGAGGIFVATADRLIRLDDRWSIQVEGVRRLWVGENRLLGVICVDHACGGHAWTLDGEALGPVVEAGERGAIYEHDGEAWAGAPDWWTPGAPGQVCAESGRCVSGAPGDHLGQHIHGGYAVGMFNKRLDVPRLRLVPLDPSRPTYAMEDGAEQAVVTLASSGDLLAVGTPYLPGAGDEAGAITLFTP